MPKRKFPEVLMFERLGLCYYDLLEFRPLEAGEYYLSGAIVQAWRASNSTISAYQVVRPTYHAKAVTHYVRGDKVELSQ